jgi:hypothetical protein
MTKTQFQNLIEVRREARRRWPGGHAAYVDGEFWVGVPEGMPTTRRAPRLPTGTGRTLGPWGGARTRPQTHWRRAVRWVKHREAVAVPK